MALNRLLIRKWIAALRSGTYTQAQSWLRGRADNSDAMCCLGVGCDISGIGSWEWKATLDGSSPAWHYVVRAEDGSVGSEECSVLPEAVSRLLGIEAHSTIGFAQPNDTDGLPDAVWRLFLECGTAGSTQLSDLNDRHSFSFAEIADVVEYALDHPETVWLAEV